MTGLVTRAVQRLASGVDDVLYRTALARGESSRRASAAESLGHAARMEALDAIHRAYDGHGDAALFPEPRRPSVETRTVRPFGRGGEIVDLAWQSEFDTLLPELSAKWLANRHSQRATARLYGIPGEGRPAIMVVHGYLGGQVELEERFWPVRELLRRGFDVALAVLPGHGRRRSSSRARPFFPGSDPRVTVEGFRQSMLDLRTLARVLRGRGASSVGVIGMSLGGYASALLATVEPELAFSIPIVPLASIADFARDGGRLVGSPDEQVAQHAALERAHAVVSPLARRPAIDPSRIVVVAGEVDRITPTSHARKLAGALGAECLIFPGGHLVQAGRARALATALDRVTRR